MVRRPSPMVSQSPRQEISRLARTFTLAVQVGIIHKFSSITYLKFPFGNI